MFSYKYLSEEYLKGLDNYKYTVVDTNPISRYVMHPFWDRAVMYLPKWLAPNLISVSAFFCLLAKVTWLLILDYDGFAADGKADGYGIPNYVYLICGVLIFIAYNLDGVDGKQARRLGVSGPLGELFDHGLDTYVIFFIPFGLLSLFGRDEFSMTTFRGFMVVVGVTLNAYCAYWEKYITGILFLPWGYDCSMWASTFLHLGAGIFGARLYKVYIFRDIPFIVGLEVVTYGVGICTTIVGALFNIYKSYTNRTGKMYPLSEAVRPLWSILVLIAAMTLWALKSSNDVLEYDPRMFLILYGTLFSNITTRLIICLMADQRCESICWMNWPLLIAVIISLRWPNLELVLLYILTPICIIIHLHYAVCLVRQFCDHFKVQCFSVPLEKLE